MPPKKDKKKKKPIKRTQQQKGKGQSQKQTQIVNIHLGKSKGRSRVVPKPPVPINIIRMNEYPQSLASQPSFQPTREPLRDQTTPSSLLYPTAVAEAMPYNEALPEVMGGAMDIEKGMPATPASAGRGRPRLTEEEKQKREQYAQLVKKQKEEEKFLAKQQKAEVKAAEKAAKGGRPVGRPRKDVLGNVISKVGGGANEKA